MREHNKTRAFLMEFVIVVLFFSIAAVITLQLFANANNKSEDNDDMINAVICAQTVAENIRSEVSEYDEEGIYIKYLDRDMNYVDEEAYYEEKVMVSIDKEASSELGQLYNYKIIIMDSNKNKEIYSLNLSKYIAKEVQR